MTFLCPGYEVTDPDWTIPFNTLDTSLHPIVTLAGWCGISKFYLIAALVIILGSKYVDQHFPLSLASLVTQNKKIVIITGNSGTLFSEHYEKMITAFRVMRHVFETNDFDDIINDNNTLSRLMFENKAVRDFCISDPNCSLFFLTAHGWHCSTIPNDKMGLIIIDEAQQALKALRDLNSTRLESVIGTVPLLFVDGEKPMELDGILYDNLHNSAKH